MQSTIHKPDLIQRKGLRYKLLAMSILMLLTNMTACVNAPGVSRGTLMHDGLERTYRLYVPGSLPAAEEVPLVMVLHGGGGTGEMIARYTHFDRIAGEHGFIAVYPDGIDRHWNDGRFEDEKPDDLGFLTKLIDTLSAQFAIDPNRVYVTGASNGGMMSLRLACEATDYFAAVACVISAIPEPKADVWSPSRPMPIIIMNGDADPLVPWEGGEITIQRQTRGRVISTPDTVAFWVKHNQCDMSPAISYLPDNDPEDGMRIREERYSGGTDGAEVVLYAVEGGGHTWPGGVQYLPEWLIGKTCHDIDGSDVIWQFFSEHPHASDGPDRADG